MLSLPPSLSVIIDDELNIFPNLFTIDGKLSLQDNLSLTIDGKLSVIVSLLL